MKRVAFKPREVLPEVVSDERDELTVRQEKIKLVEILAKGATPRQAALEMEVRQQRVDSLLKMIVKEYDLDPESYRVVSLETLGLISKELWAKMKENPWRTADFLLKIEERKAALLGLDKEEGQAAGSKLSIGTVQNLVLQYNAQETKNLLNGTGRNP